MAQTKAQSIEVQKYIALTLASHAHFETLKYHLEKHWTHLAPFVLNVLLYVPEVSEISKYISIIRLAARGPSTLETPMTESNDIDVLTCLANIDTSKSTIRKAMDGIQLRPISLLEFLDERVRLIDHNTGLLNLGIDLLSSFPDMCMEWRRGIVKPAASLRACGINVALEELEALTPEKAAQTLLESSHDEDLEQVFQDGLLPVVYYRGHTSKFCSSVASSLRGSTQIHLATTLRVLSSTLQSSLGSTEMLDIATASLYACYVNMNSTEGSNRLAELQTIVAVLSKTFKDEIELTLDFSERVYESYSDFEAQLLHPESDLQQLLIPCKPSLLVLRRFVDASTLFGTLRRSIEVLLGTKQRQENELSRLLLTSRSDSEFREFREFLISRAIFAKLPIEELESKLLRSLLLRKHTELAKKLYVAATPRPLRSRYVEQAITESFHELFDNAGSLSRRDLGPASQVLTIIHPKHTNEVIRQCQLLVDTLIEISAYKGSQHILPIQLRQGKSTDITDLFSRLLQESNNYKKHFRLLGLYQNVCLSLNQEPNVFEFRELVVNAALAFDDLEYALKLVEEEDELCADVDDAELGGEGSSDAWRLIYQICKYPSESVPVIEHQLDLLSKGISFCPPDNIHQMLSVFRQLENSLASAKAEVAEFDPWDIEDHDDEDDRSSKHPKLRHNDSTLSTNSSRATKIEMPQWRLFEAAQAATRTARTFLPQTNEASETTEGRVRKRDQLAGLVGSGVGAVESKFTSGLGWISVMSLLSFWQLEYATR